MRVNIDQANSMTFISNDKEIRPLVQEFVRSWSQVNVGPMKIWCPYGMTGEEVYSLAMILSSNLSNNKQFQIIFTESNLNLLKIAANGVYAIDKLKDIPLEFRNAHLEIGTGDIANWFRIKKGIKSKIEFRNISQDKVTGAFDLIYLNESSSELKDQNNINHIVLDFVNKTKDNGLILINKSLQGIQVPNSCTRKSPKAWSKKAKIFGKPAASTNNNLAHIRSNSQSEDFNSEIKLSPVPRTRVFVVDDSKTIRDLLTKILSESTDLEVIGSAPNPILADPLIKKLRPDVITLDIHMPEMDGVSYLEKLLPEFPVPVVMITSISLEEGGTVFKALELGAVDYIQKPTMAEVKHLAPLIREKVKAAAFANLRIRDSRSISNRKIKSGISGQPLDKSTVIVIGSSTGGTEALREILTQLPAEIPPTLIVQHIPPVFSKAFADRLNDLCEFRVKEAEEGDLLEPSLVLIAPGGKQMALKKSSRGLYVVLTDDPPVNRHKPSVDYLFESVAKLSLKSCIGAILTGMGDDGARGLLQLKNGGARTLAQDEKSCVVYGMPRAAVELGAANSVHPLDEIAGVLIRMLQKSKAS